ncbi:MULTISPECIES: PAS domain S-box protein [unclassified Flavobacterium]|uniref:PAS domain S-box protein n=1 Tax=unclassified Flavobacterium TaxID=196869 RepID=UPI0012A87158|nr:MULTISPECIES: PAS domain S-box protein [unclassified Flavobacterium]MBF4487343.1 PAS domain S-box protein [Flavobacterium sp. CSZ]QGK72731.1 PAS domain S-box protein [Flavobacterium sp. SLB02]
MSFTDHKHYFLSDGGEMGKLIRSKDWSKTPLGDPDNWPQSLKTIVALMLNNPFGMLVVWGNDYTQIYNDTYSQILGSKHPKALGISSQITFSEVWDILAPMFHDVMKGSSVSFPDFKLTLDRNGYDEDCYFDFSYSHIKKEDGVVGGLLVTVIETTEKVRATAALKESNLRFRNNIMQAPVAMCVMRGKDHVVEIANDQMIQLWGVEASEILNKPVFDALPETRNQYLEDVLNNVYKTGIKFVANEQLVKLPRNGKIEDTYLNFVYEALRETDGTISGVVGIAIEVTSQVLSRSKVVESEQKVRELVENAPFPIALYAGKEMIVELANDSIIKIWGKGNDVIGKSFKDVVPELDNQLVFEQISEVLNSGKSFHTQNTPLDLTVNGKLGTYYFNYSLTPIYDINGNIYGVMNTGVDLTDLNLAKKKIEESEQNLRSMVSQSPIGICVLDAETLITEIVNDSFIEVAGKKYEEIAGKNYWDAFAEVRSAYEVPLQRVISEGNPFYANEVEMPLIRHGKKETIYVTFVYAPLKNIEGKVTKIAIWVLDNTPQVNARRKIEEADKRFRNTVKQAPVGITILRGPNHVAEMANEAYLKLVGREESTFIGKPLFDSLPEVRGTVGELLDTVYSTGVAYHGNELPVPINRFGNPEIFYFDFLYHPLKEENGEISGIIVTVTEVTEKVEARKKTELNEERLNIIVEASELGTWELYVKAKDLQYSNRYLEIVTGYKDAEHLTHAQLLSHVHPDDLHIREKAFKEAISLGNIHYEARVIWDDQSIHWVEAKGKVFYDSENNPERLLGTVRDITDEKNHQQELEASEKRFRKLVMESPVPKAILKGKDMVIEMVNAAMLKNIWRKNESDVQGKSILEVFPELKKQKYARLLNEVYSTGNVHSESESLFYIMINSIEHKMYIDFEFAPQRELDDTISGIKITMIDVTEKVEARKKIEESEKRFRSLTESIPQLIWETDDKGNALFTSGKWFEYTGVVPNGEAAWKAMIHPDDFDENSRIWNKSLTTGTIYKADVRVLRKDGTYRWHSVIGEPVLNKDNKIIKWVGAFTDIQTEKAFTQELEKQVTARTKELEQKNVELEQMNKELQSFAYISSHDLQEPLRKIQTFATQIIEKESENLSDSGKDKFQRMQNAAQRMQTLINDLLSYSRTNIQERKFEKINLSKIIDEVKEDLKEELEQKGAIIEIDNTCEASIIPFQFRQLLYNLASNSLKFANPDIPTIIKINCEFTKGENLNNESLAKEANYCHISISDNGIGFEPQYSKKIFEVFQRLHGKLEYTGTGIGLAIVKKIVENHNGTITAKGEKNKGATFDIYIPVV